MNFKKLFHDSYERAVSTNPDYFFTEFYRLFIGKSELIEQMFSNTDMQKQRASLIVSFMQMVWFADERCSDEVMEQLAMAHDELGIKGDLYELWMDSLIETLRLVDPQNEHKDELAWRVILSPGLTFMKYFNA